MNTDPRPSTNEKPPFATWVRLCNQDRNDPIGDLAEDAHHDPDWPSTAGHKELRTYLEDLGACDGALEALERAWVEYRS